MLLPQFGGSILHNSLITSSLRARLGIGIPFTYSAVVRQVQNDEQAVGGGEEGPPLQPPAAAAGYRQPAGLPFRQPAVPFFKYL